MKKTTRLVLILASALATNAAAQTGGWSIETNSVISPSNPTTTIEVWAWFDDPTGFRDSFAHGNYDIIANDGVFSNPKEHLWPFSPGTPIANAVIDVDVGQFWGGLGMFANDDNPILVWSADWTATDFQPRTVALSTLNTTTFRIGKNSTHGGMLELELYPEGFSHGTGAISVVPSPATTLPIALLGTLALGRRRTS